MWKGWPRMMPSWPTPRRRHNDKRGTRCFPITRRTAAIGGGRAADHQAKHADR